MSNLSIDTAEASEAELRATLVATYGAVVGGKELARALGFRTQSAFRKALNRGALSVQLFQMPGRRGRFALCTELATWLWNQRQDSYLPDRTGGATSQTP